MYAEQAPTNTQHPIALGPDQAYRFEDDRVELDCSLHAGAASEDGTTYRLQLWACPCAYLGGTLQGVKVAEASIDLGWGTAQSISVPAYPPAGTQAHTMVLVLVAIGPDGSERIVDYTNYARPETFLQPRMQGTVAYRLDGDRLYLTVGEVCNPRAADNLSGSLSLELWALEQPYAGGAFHGIQLGGTCIGTLQGQQSFYSLDLSLPRPPLPAGPHTLVLMLREWTTTGYMTRDYSNFALPVSGEAPQPVAAEVEAPAAPKAPARPRAPRKVAAAEPVAAVPTETVSPAVMTESEAPVSVTKRRKQAHSKAAEDTLLADAHRLINDASKEALKSIKGVSASLSKTLLQGRPYTGPEALLKVKGLGAKTLRRILDHLKG